MSPLATGRFQIGTWDEKPLEDPEGGPKLARASVAETFTGDLEGEARVEYLLAYGGPDAAQFTGFSPVAGRLAGRTGTFVLQRAGVYAAGAAMATWNVVPGSGRGGLQGLRGEGAFVAAHRDQPVEWAGRSWEPTPHGIAAFTLDYDFD
ncbi:MAG TPA: DUF3224 domain-containing protein [Candidatus Eisenbacteria bacterium]|nr:DUF3224 domain-containing protein [Candidatus Eisenbacteria bacterium]